MPFHLSVLPLSIPRDFKNGFHVGETFCTGSAENEIFLIAGGQVPYEQTRGHFLCAPSCSCLQTIPWKRCEGEGPSLCSVQICLTPEEGTDRAGNKGNLYCEWNLLGLSLVFNQNYLSSSYKKLQPPKSCHFSYAVQFCPV